jgi:hypothetical protein
MEEAYKPNSITISNPYLILWIGENGYVIDKVGRLVVIKPSYYGNAEGRRGEQMTAVLTVARLERGEIPFEPGEYIVAGGMHPIGIFRVHAIMRAKESAGNLHRASGLKSWGYGFWGIPVTPEMKELKDEYDLATFRPIVCDWPEKFAISMAEDGGYQLTKLPSRPPGETDP